MGKLVVQELFRVAQGLLVGNAQMLAVFLQLAAADIEHPDQVQDPPAVAAGQDLPEAAQLTLPFLSQVRVKLQGFSRIVAPRYFLTILAEQYAVFPLLVADLEATDQMLL